MANEKFKQVFGREQFIERDELFFVRTIRLIVAQINVGKGRWFVQLCDKGLCNVLYRKTRSYYLLNVPP